LGQPGIPPARALLEPFVGAVPRPALTTGFLDAQDEERVGAVGRKAEVSGLRPSPSAQSL
jgi:hypothetical protein